MKKTVSGVPLGGIGAGKIELCRDGRFRNFTGFNNPEAPIANGYEDKAISRAYFASYVEGEGAVALSEAADETPALGEGKIKAKEKFPFVELDYGKRGDVALSLSAFSSTKLHNAEKEYIDSSIPGAHFTLRATNESSKEKYVSFAFTLDNLIGEGGFPGVYFRDKRTNFAEERPLEGGLAVVHAHKKPKAEQRLNGNTAMAVVPKGAATASLRLWGDQSFWLGRGSDVWTEFDETGKFAKQKINDDSLYGVTAATLAAGQSLKPGETLEVSFMMAWHFPDRYVTEEGVVAKNMYARWFRHSMDTVTYLRDNASRLEQETRAWQKHIERSNLPDWMQQRLIDSLFVLNSNSMHLIDGRFGVSEAPTQMAGCMGTIDQRASSSSIYSMCFPELGKSELGLFMEQQIDEHHPKRFGEHWDTKKGKFGLQLDRLGAVRHDTGWEHLEGGQLGSKYWTNLHWPDLTSVYTLQIYEQYAWGSDKGFLERAYPKVLQALEFQARLDQDEDGVADLWGPGCSTYDNENFPFYGVSAFVGTLYLAALRAAERMAIWMDDKKEAEKLRARFAKTKATVENVLFSEEHGYYKNWVDPRHKDWAEGERPHGVEDPSCFVSQLAGEWFAERFGFGPLLNQERVQSALKEIGKRNVDAVPGCPANESSPEGKTTHSWPYYIETYYAANAIQKGLPELGVEALKKIYRAFYEVDGNPYSATLTWEGDTNEKAHWGRWYMTNPSIWFLPQAFAGFNYVSRDAELALAPQYPTGWEKLEKCPIFMPGFWGSVSANGSTSEFTVDRLVGEKPLSLSRLRSARAPKEIVVNGSAVSFKADESDTALVVLESEQRLSQGDSLIVRY